MYIINKSLKSFVEYFPNVNKNTLVVFDIDYTILRATTILGTPEWLYHLVQQEMLTGTNAYNSFAKWYPIWMKAQKFNEVVLMEKNINILLERVKKEAMGYIMLTARHPSTEKITYRQLRKLGINFEDSFSININYHSKFKYSTSYNNNILFSHDLNEKSFVFADWIKQVIEQCDKNHSIKKIIFIDDLEKNVISMLTTVRNIGMEYIGIHYSAGEIYKARFKPNLAERQAEILIQNYPDIKIKKLLKNPNSLT